jgi:hypothetical protein
MELLNGFVTSLYCTGLEYVYAQIAYACLLRLRVRR